MVRGGQGSVRGRTIFNVLIILHWSGVVRVVRGLSYAILMYEITYVYICNLIHDLKVIEKTPDHPDQMNIIRWLQTKDP